MSYTVHYFSFIYRIMSDNGTDQLTADIIKEKLAILFKFVMNHFYHEMTSEKIYELHTELEKVSPIPIVWRPYQWLPLTPVTFTITYAIPPPTKDFIYNSTITGLLQFKSDLRLFLDVANFSKFNFNDSATTNVISFAKYAELSKFLNYCFHNLGRDYDRKKFEAVAVPKKRARKTQTKKAV
ncbi:unnamed protein product [Caenorhabditis bovis]|uniref:Uncharacterized protein n=1 Tax=Caenorhabditis bovis TaxID=2654633 RepID=A0A8S1EN51_9PELO|nr:unnamed protein product [Caenorhabditis bovis]